MQPKYDLLGQEIAQNPYPIWQQMQQEDPIYGVTLQTGQTLWYITRHDLVQQVLKDHDTFSSNGNFLQAPPQMPPVLEILSKDMLLSNPPDHTRLRALVSKAFTPRSIREMTARIHEVTNQLIDSFISRGQMDLVADFAFPLPMQIISDIIGIPADDFDHFRAWTQSLVTAPTLAGHKPSPEEMQAFVATMSEFLAYLRTLIAKRRQDPQDDLLTRLLEAQEDGDRLSENELLSMLKLLIAAGHETTVNLISNGVWALLQNPDQLQLLKENPDLMSSAVEELLRYGSPVDRASARIAYRDTEIGGQPIRHGDVIRLMIGATSRDPQQYEQPHKLDIQRDNRASLAFGQGIHYCIGAPLARLEGQIAINTLFNRIPDLHLAVPAGELIWTSPGLVRGLTALPVAWWPHT